jgi:uncharacterized protein YgiB involved in biofilm formation
MARPAPAAAAAHTIPDAGAAPRPRRRSPRVATLLAGGAAAALLAACEERPTQQFYSSFAECTREFSEAECRAAEQTAQEAHRAAAPRFATREACEAQMGEGACDQVQDAQAPGGGWFMPAMMGYLLGRTVGGFGATPVYVDRRGYAYAGSRPWGTLSRADQLAREQGRWSPGYRPQGAPPPRVDVRPPTPGASSLGQAAERPRGGFGSTGRVLGGGGG